MVTSSIFGGIYGRNETAQPRQVALLCKEDIELFQLATRPNVNTQQEYSGFSSLLFLEFFLVFSFCS
jgi:hypothetical protein